MRNFNTNHADTATIAVKCFFNGVGNGLRKQEHGSQVIIIQVKQFISLRFWYHKCMPFSQGENIQEGKKPFILRYFVRGYFSFDNFRENGHNPCLNSIQQINQIEISSTLNLMTPAGAVTSATSPICFPSNPFPIGEVTEILPAFRSASFSLTIW